MVGATAITTHTYTLDAEGNRTQLVEFLSGVTPSGQTETFGYSYDGLNRLAAVSTTNPESFTLDGASNITARTGPAATYTIDGENRPTSDGTNTLTWSSADRLTGRGADTFGYDALDRLTSSTVAGTGRSYAYSGDGLLQSRTQGTATSFLWDPATSPSRLLAQGGDRVIYGLGPLYIIKADGTTRSLARDGGKSLRAEVDGSGTVTGSWRYRAYGETSQTSGQTTPSILGFAGQLLDPSGLYYMRARWYDAASGRFMTRDPLPGGIASPNTLNAFLYASSRPGIRVDPSGLRDTTAADGDGVNCSLACRSKLALDGFFNVSARLLDALLPTPPHLPDAVLDIIAGDDPRDRAVAEAAWQHVAGLTMGPKVSRQLASRGWTKQTVHQTASSPDRTMPVRDTRFNPATGSRNNEPATAYINRDGSYVVVNDSTQDVVQVSDRLDPNWKAPWR